MIGGEDGDVAGDGRIGHREIAQITTGNPLLAERQTPSRESPGAVILQT
jgi:hypothetical protein